ncbi:hypothetical protein VTG60DRAFT_1410 [Thermothelomyces hinnuleus]
MSCFEAWSGSRVVSNAVQGSLALSIFGCRPPAIGLETMSCFNGMRCQTKRTERMQSPSRSPLKRERNEHGLRRGARAQARGSGSERVPARASGPRIRPRVEEPLKLANRLPSSAVSQALPYRASPHKPRPPLGHPTRNFSSPARRRHWTTMKRLAGHTARPRYADPTTGPGHICTSSARNRPKRSQLKDCPMTGG